MEVYGELDHRDTLSIAVELEKSKTKNEKALLRATGLTQSPPYEAMSVYL